MPGKPTVYDPPPRHVTIILFDEISEVAVHPPGVTVPGGVAARRDGCGSRRDRRSPGVTGQYWLGGAIRRTLVTPMLVVVHPAGIGAA
jgi:hypothetical protein